MQLSPIVPDQAAGLTGVLRRDAATLAGSNAIQVLPVELIKGDARLATLVVPPPVGAESLAFVPIRDVTPATDSQGDKGASQSNPQAFRSSGFFQSNTLLDELNLGEWLRRILRQSGIFAAQDLAEHVMARSGGSKTPFGTGERSFSEPFQGLLSLYSVKTTDAETDQTVDANGFVRPQSATRSRDTPPSEAKSLVSREAPPIESVDWAARDLKVTQDQVSRSQIESWLKSIDANSTENYSAIRCVATKRGQIKETRKRSRDFCCGSA
ncbi:MAG: hypothetical protein EBV69_05350 [Oxalobacteraceae bacterium]|nr:hypothetical protein [Oxalobacteraceae bacterium]